MAESFVVCCLISSVLVTLSMELELDYVSCAKHIESDMCASAGVCVCVCERTHQHGNLSSNVNIHDDDDDENNNNNNKKWLCGTVSVSVYARSTTCHISSHPIYSHVSNVVHNILYIYCNLIYCAK